MFKESLQNVQNGLTCLLLQFHAYHALDRMIRSEVHKVPESNTNKSIIKEFYLIQLIVSSNFWNVESHQI